MLYREASSSAARWLIVKTMCASLLAICAWYLLKDHELYRSMSVSMSCFDPRDCQYKIPFVVLGIIAAVVFLVGALTMLPGRMSVACLFPAATSAALWAAIKLTERFWTHDSIWLESIVISHAILLAFLLLPFIQRGLPKRASVS